MPGCCCGCQCSASCETGKLLEELAAAKAAVAAFEAAAAVSAAAAAAAEKKAAAAEEKAAEETRKRKQWKPENRLIFKYKCNEATEKKPALRQLLEESGKVINALMSTYEVFNAIIAMREVGVTPEELNKGIDVEFRSSRKTFQNKYCHGWTLPCLDHKVFIDSLY